MAAFFTDAAKLAPEDADVHVVLGVLYNLTREFDRAIEAFQTALKLKPQDYSLWNKLGATQANSVHSADAILAYQQVAKPSSYLTNPSIHLDFVGSNFLQCMVKACCRKTWKIYSCHNFDTESRSYFW